MQMWEQSFMDVLLLALCVSVMSSCAWRQQHDKLLVY